MDKKLVLHLVLLMVVWTEIKMACWRKEDSESHLVHLMELCLALMSQLDLLMVNRLALMKASYSALLMVNYSALHLELQMESHLGLMKELSWLLQIAPLMVLMKANLRVPCLELDLDKKLVLHLVLLIVLWTEIKMAFWREQHSGSHLVHLMEL